jgi:iron complex outermembrane receptor protein
MRRRSSISQFQMSAIALAIAATSGVAVPALAQEAGLEEIVVTAQRREESLQDTPISITAFTENKLTDLGVFDVAQVADFAPNVNIQKQPSSNGNMGIFIRGMGMGETSLLADPKVGMYIDGVFMSKTVGAVFDVVDIERVEVLRGPQGTLFGRNTTGGAVNVTTKKPTGEWGFKADASVGNFGYSRTGVSIDFPKIANVAAKVSLNRMKTDGWADNNYSGPAQTPMGPRDEIAKNLASEDNWAGRLALRWTPTEAVTVDYSYDMTDNQGVPAPFQITKVKDSLYNGFSTTPFPFTFLGGSLYQDMAATVGDPKKRRDDYNLDAVSDEWLDIEGHTLTVAWELSDTLTLKYIGGMRSVDSGYDSTDLDSGAYIARDLFYGGGAAVPTPGFHAAIDKGNISTDTHELQIIGSLMDEKLFFTGGLFTYKEKVIQVNPQTFSLPIAFIAQQGANTPFLGPLYNGAGFCPPQFGGFVCTGTQRLPLFDSVGEIGVSDFSYGGDSESVAAYGQVTYKFTEQFDVTAGIRYTEDDKDQWLYNQSLDINAATPGTQVGRVEADDTWNNTSYVVVGNYKITDDVSTYLKYSTGYNGGGFNARASTLGSFTTPFAEEEVESWELGMKSEWWENRLRVNAAVFTNDYTDIQIAQFEAGSGGASSRIVNAGAGTYQGLELEVVLVPVDGLTIEASYGYLDAEYDEFLARNPATNQLEDISGITTVTQAPENSANVGVQYDFAPIAIGQISARVDVAYKDAFVFHPFNNQFDSTDDRTLVNARLSLSDVALGDGSLRVSLWGKNLTDEEYRNWGIDFGSLGFAGAVYGEPRTYGLDLTYQYQ